MSLGTRLFYLMVFISVELISTHFNSVYFISFLLSQLIFVIPFQLTLSNFCSLHLSLFHRISTDFLLSHFISARLATGLYVAEKYKDDVWRWIVYFYRVINKAIQHRPCKYLPSFVTLAISQRPNISQEWLPWVFPRGQIFYKTCYPRCSSENRLVSLLIPGDLVSFFFISILLSSYHIVSVIFFLN